MTKARSVGSTNGKSLPVSRDSAVDSELADLMKEFPGPTKGYLDDLFEVRRGRFKSDPDTDAKIQASTVRKPHPKPDISHYKEIYIQKSGRPRSTKRPKPIPVEESAFNAMRVEKPSYETSNEAFFKLQDYTPRIAALKIEDNYKPSDATFEKVSTYRQDYIPKAVEHQLAEAPLPQHQRSGDDIKFYGTTTSKEAYQSWEPQKRLHFGELPVFTGSIMYPNKNRQFNSTTRDTYIGEQGERPPLAKGAPSNLTLAGEHHFMTTTGDTYRPNEGPIERVQPFGKASQRKDEQRQPLMSETQFMRDFKGFKAGQPRPPKPILPKQSTLDLSTDEEDYFQTTNRRVFQGHDTREHPVPKPFKRDQAYKPSTNGFANTSITKTDYIPIDLSLAFSAHVKPPKPQEANVISFDATTFANETTSQGFFKDWSRQLPKDRVRHGDFHEGYSWVPPVHPLAGESETKSAFPLKHGQPVESFKPVQQPIATLGSHDFTTVHKKTYRDGKKYHLSKQQAAILKRELQHLKLQGQVPAVAS